MATLIPNYQLKDFQALEIEELKRLKCCEVYEGNDYLFTFIMPGTTFIRSQAENFGQLSNSVAGEDLYQITGEQAIVEPVEAEITDYTDAGKVKVKRTYKKHKHRAKKVTV